MRVCATTKQQNDHASAKTLRAIHTKFSHYPTRNTKMRKEKAAYKIAQTSEIGNPHKFQSLSN